MKYDIFLSHSSQDRDWVIPFEQRLRELDLRVFDQAEIQVGERWADALEDALRESEYVVLLVSNRTINSNWAAAELGAALALKKRLIPIVDQDVSSEEMPGPIKIRQYLSKGDPIEVADRVAKAIAGNEVNSANAKDNGDSKR